VIAVTALALRQPLLFPAFRTAAVHFPSLHEILEEKTALRAFLGVSFANLGSTVLHGADENRFAGITPVFTLFFFLADGTFFHGKPL